LEVPLPYAGKREGRADKGGARGEWWRSALARIKIVSRRDFLKRSAEFGKKSEMRYGAKKFLAEGGGFNATTQIGWSWFPRHAGRRGTKLSRWQQDERGRPPRENTFGVDQAVEQGSVLRST